MLKELDLKLPVDLEVVTLDLARNRGGDYLELKQVVQTGKKKEEAKTKSPVEKSKNPSHGKNYTRNVKLPNSKVRTIHIHLIKKFNGKEVIP